MHEYYKKQPFHPNDVWTEFMLVNERDVKSVKLHVHVLPPVEAEQGDGDGEARVSHHLHQPSQTFSSQAAQQRTNALQRPRQEGQRRGTHLLRTQRPPNTPLVLKTITDTHQGKHKYSVRLVFIKVPFKSSLNTFFSQMMISSFNLDPNTANKSFIRS